MGELLVSGGVILFNYVQLPSLKLTANAPENRPKRTQKERRIVFQPSIFRCKLAVSFREGNPKLKSEDNLVHQQSQTSFVQLPLELMNFDEITNLHLMVNCWFGSRWFGILRVHPSNNPFHKGIPNIQTTGPQSNN